jgi:hypothetical protein
MSFASFYTDFDGIAEILAPAIHNFYRQLAKQEGWKVAYDIPYDQLPAFIKEDNRAAAARIPRILRLVDLTVVPKNRPGNRSLEEIRNVLEKNIELLAEAEHNGWMDHKLSHGWLYGSIRNDAKKIHPALKPYEQLSQKDKEKDRHAVQAFPSIVVLAGYKIASVLIQADPSSAMANNPIAPGSIRE